uniref:Uncharacterized protein n=1 Tax=Rousettus aegyptiacus TaxID=9407 RepID=A0A7J8KBF9_ROUAE|nr:hypothetical protein HJG63_007999 [Rousettus aegyptiacus]
MTTGGPTQERGTLIAANCSLFPATFSTQLSPLPCNPAYSSWLPTREGLEVGREAKAWRDWGSSDWKEAIFVLCLLCCRGLETEFSLVPASSSAPSLSPTALLLSLPQSIFSKHLLLLSKPFFCSRKLHPAFISIIAK